MKLGMVLQTYDGCPDEIINYDTDYDGILDVDDQLYQ